MKRYQHLEDGQRIVIPAQPTGEVLHKMACCDCGLVHNVRLKKTKQGLELTAWRDRRATAAKRRSKPLTVRSAFDTPAALHGRKNR